ncbi:MAG: hypothetical protein ACI9V1_003604 [Spirosomataceae bacterium]|jgi:hypothetical protein
MRIYDDIIDFLAAGTTPKKIIDFFPIYFSDYQSYE